MSLLSDLLIGLLELLIGAGAPEDNRVLLLLVSFSGFCLSCLNGWLVLFYPIPLREPWWGFGAIVVGILLGSVGSMLSGLHLVRLYEDRALAATGLVLNIGAVVIALVAAS